MPNFHITYMQTGKPDHIGHTYFRDLENMEQAIRTFAAAATTDPRDRIICIENLTEGSRQSFGLLPLSLQARNTLHFNLPLANSIQNLSELEDLGFKLLGQTQTADYRWICAGDPYIVYIDCWMYVWLYDSVEKESVQVHCDALQDLKKILKIAQLNHQK